jgi:hypothetical protein
MPAYRATPPATRSPSPNARVVPRKACRPDRLLRPGDRQPRTRGSSPERRVGAGHAGHRGRPCRHRAPYPLDGTGRWHRSNRLRRRAPARRSRGRALHQACGRHRPPTVSDAHQVIAAAEEARRPSRSPGRPLDGPRPAAAVAASAVSCITRRARGPSRRSPRAHQRRDAVKCVMRRARDRPYPGSGPATVRALVTCVTRRARGRRGTPRDCSPPAMELERVHLTTHWPRGRPQCAPGERLSTSRRLPPAQTARQRSPDGNLANARWDRQPPQARPAPTRGSGRRPPADALCPWGVVPAGNPFGGAAEPAPAVCPWGVGPASARAARRNRGEHRLGGPWEVALARTRPAASTASLGAQTAVPNCRSRRAPGRRRRSRNLDPTPTTRTVDRAASRALHSPRPQPVAAAPETERRRPQPTPATVRRAGSFRPCSHHGPCSRRNQQRRKPPPVETGPSTAGQRRPKPNPVRPALRRSAAPIGVSV